MEKQLVAVLVINTINNNDDPAWKIVDKLIPAIQATCNSSAVPNVILIMNEYDQSTAQVIGDKLPESVDTVRSVSAVADVPNVIEELVGNCFGDILILGEYCCARELHEIIEIEGVRPVTPLVGSHLCYTSDDIQEVKQNKQIYGFVQGFSQDQVNDMPYRIISTTNPNSISKYIHLAIASGYVPCGPLQYAGNPAPVFGNYWQTLYAPGNELEQNVWQYSQVR